jgi:hypothetical protein
MKMGDDVPQRADDPDMANYEYPFGKSFRGRPMTLQYDIETMWHMAELSIRGLLSLVNDESKDPAFRKVTIYLAKCWLKDYRELDRRRDQELEARS